MNGYTPLFSQVVDSSLWDEPLHVRVLFMTLMALKDWDHVARVQDHHLRKKANLATDAEVLDGLRILSSPDTRTSIAQPYEGRRIERVEEGWLILNGDKYQALMLKCNERAKWAKQKREQRLKEKANGKPKRPSRAWKKSADSPAVGEEAYLRATSELAPAVSVAEAEMSHPGYQPEAVDE